MVGIRRAALEACVVTPAPPPLLRLSSALPPCRWQIGDFDLDEMRFTSKGQVGIFPYVPACTHAWTHACRPRPAPRTPRCARALAANAPATFPAPRRSSSSRAPTAARRDAWLAAGAVLRCAALHCIAGLPVANAALASPPRLPRHRAMNHSTRPCSPSIPPTTTTDALLQRRGRAVD